MLWKLFRLSTKAVALAAVWLGLVLIFILPRTSPEWIPFWIGVWIGLVCLWKVSQQFRHGAGLRRHQLALKLGAIPAALLGAALIVSNEVQARRTGDWEGYLTLLGLIIVAHAVICLLLLRHPESQA